MMRVILMCAAGILGAQVSPVQKVVQLLDELKGKVHALFEAERMALHGRLDRIHMSHA